MNDVKMYLSSDLYDYTTKYLIMQGGKVLAFDFRGNYKGEVRPNDYNKIIEVDIVSILHFKEGYELATHVNKQFKKMTPNIPLVDLYKNIVNHKGIKASFTRSGVKDGEVFKQYFFVFTPGTFNVSMFD